MVFNCVINKNNFAFVINLIYVLGDYAARLPTFIFFFNFGLKCDQDIFGPFTSFLDEKKY